MRRLLLLLSLLLTVPAVADEPPPDLHKLAPALPTFRPKPQAPLAPPPADPRDLNGTWWLTVTNPELTPMGSSDRPPFTPAGAAIFWHRIEMNNLGTPVPDAAVMCRPMGPRVLTSPYPQEILQTPDRIVFIFEEHHVVQQVYMNASHPSDLKPSYMGHSVGHWEGDTLVVDSIGFNDRTWLDAGGTPHSGQLHLVQRIRKHGGTLEEQVTVTDPVMFSRPWTYQLILEWRPDTTIDEMICESNMHDAQMQMADKDWTIDDARRSLKK